MSQDAPDTPANAGFPFTPKDAMEFMQKMWNPLGIPFQALAAGSAVPGATAVPGMSGGSMPFYNPLAMFAAIDPQQVQRKIDELRVIEGWLQMSLNMMQMSIKTMELQKASLEAMRGSAAAG
jgi:hypothetical protein